MLQITTDTALSAPTGDPYPDILTGLQWIHQASTLDGLADGADVLTWSVAAGSRTDVILNQTNATAGRKPTLTKNAQGSKSAVKFLATSTQYIQSPALTGVQIGMPHTAYMVFKRGVVAAGQTVITGGVDASIGRYLSIGFNTNGSVIAGAGSSTGELTYAAAITDNTTLHFVAVTYTGTTVSRIYIDGLYVEGSLGVAAPANAYLPRLTLGANTGLSSSWADGLLFEEGAYNRALNPSDIASLRATLRVKYGF